MGTSLRSSSTLKNPFQTFKSFYTIQPTTRTIRMKFVLMLSLTVLVAGQMVTSVPLKDLSDLYEGTGIQRPKELYGDADAERDAVFLTTLAAARDSEGKRIPMERLDSTNLMTQLANINGPLSDREKYGECALAYMFVYAHDQLPQSVLDKLEARKDAELARKKEMQAQQDAAKDEAAPNKKKGDKIEERQWFSMM